LAKSKTQPIRVENLITEGSGASMKRPEKPKGWWISQSGFDRYRSQLRKYASELNKKLGNSDAIKEPSRPGMFATVQDFDRYDDAYEAYVTKLEKTIDKLEQEMAKAKAAVMSGGKSK
jgi:hypothetical protein